MTGHEQERPQVPPAADGLALEVGNLIRGARERAGLTQAQVADRLGCTPTAVSYWESGARHLPPVQVSRMAAALGVTAPDLLPSAWFTRPPSAPVPGERPDTARLRKRCVEDDHWVGQVQAPCSEAELLDLLDWIDAQPARPASPVRPDVRDLPEWERFVNTHRSNHQPPHPECDGCALLAAADRDEPTPPSAPGGTT